MFLIIIIQKLGFVLGFNESKMPCQPAMFHFVLKVVILTVLRVLL